MSTPRFGLLERFGRALLSAFALVSFTGAAPVQAQQTEVALAGFAYSGDSATIDSRFPYTVRYEAALASSGASSHQLLARAVAQDAPLHLKVVQQLDELNGHDQALVVALVINSETVSIEQFGKLRKLFVLIKGQTLFFDFKSMAIVRAYPVSFAYLDVFDRQPLEAEILDRVRQVYEGSGGKPGLYARFAGNLVKASIPAQVPRYLQVSTALVKPEALDAIPAYLKSGPGVAETWAADLVGEALSTRVGVPIIPYAKGYAIGNVMSVRVSDGKVYNLTLPKPDYQITVELNGFKKVKFGEVAAGASFVYGVFANLKIEEPLTGKLYLNTALKNGETKVVPVTQTYVDDFPAFYDAVNGLFVKLSDTIDGRGNTWVKTAAGAPDIEKQVAQTKELMKLCK